MNDIKALFKRCFLSSLFKKSALTKVPIQLCHQSKNSCIIQIENKNFVKGGDGVAPLTPPSLILQFLHLKLPICLQTILFEGLSYFLFGLGIETRQNPDKPELSEQ